MDRIGELEVFVAVADLRGFARAGRRLGISPAQVSKVIARLEDRLNSRLFNRTTRDVSLTDEGRALHARARVLVEEFDQPERSAQETAKPRGVLKLSAPISFGQPAAPVTMYVVYPHARHLASKVRVFVDFLIERYSRTKTKSARCGIDGATCAFLRILHFSLNKFGGAAANHVSQGIGSRP